MAWSSTNFQGVWVFEPTIWKDDRGYFFETYSKRNLPDELQYITFVQENEAFSLRGVIRGLHFQQGPHAQSKLVRVVQGEVLDVIVDLRLESPTFGQHMSILLNDMTKKQFFVPKGFAHGYITLSETAIFSYKCDAFYDKNSEGGLHCADPSLGIDWILPTETWIMSPKDETLPFLSQLNL